MRLYQDRILIDRFPYLQSRKGRILNRLAGINFSGREQVSVEPVYLPLVCFEKHGGVATVEINLHRPLWIVFLFSRWPYIHIQKVTEETIE